MILFYSNKTWKRSFDSAQDDKRIDVILSGAKDLLYSKWERFNQIADLFR